MVFNSLEFLGFFVTAGLGYLFMPARARWIWLLVASLAFYAYAGPAFVLQVLAATALSYFIAFVIAGARTDKSRNIILAAGITVLAINLSLFKYGPSFNAWLAPVAGWSGADSPLIPLVMPLGISFYTFQLIGYLIDVYRGDKPERHFGIFTLYVMLFPKVVAGPIERSRNLLPQLHSLSGFSLPLAIGGLQLVIWGLFKKVVVADRLAPFVDRVYSAPQDFDGVATSIATFLYAFQLYFDFSGYTDIALGTAMILGIRLMQNFDRPYFAVSIQDFWKRWHISLTSWLTDYVYTPMTRASWLKVKLYYLILISLMVTFLLSGIWHGSTWTFVAWGALHGSFIVISLLVQKPWNQFAKRIGLTKYPRSYRAFRVLKTFALVCFAYILFRAGNMPDAIHIMTHLGTGWADAGAGLASVVQGNRTEFLLGLLGIAVVMAPEFYPDRWKPEDAASWPVWRRWGLQYAGVVAILMLGAFDGLSPQFIYFQF